MNGKIFIGILGLLFIFSTVSAGTIIQLLPPPGFLCCGHPLGPSAPAEICYMFCGDICFPCGDFTGFGYSCTGGYGYGYSCNDDDGGRTNPKLSIEFATDCDEHIVTVESGNNPVSGVSVTVYAKGGAPIASGTTDSNGEFTFAGPDKDGFCDYNLEIYANKDGYKSAYAEDSLILCSRCEGGQPECTVNNDCPSDEVCLEGECAPLVCGDNEVVADHDCKEKEQPPPGCQGDEECGAGKVCRDGNCEAAPEPECESDADCAGDQFCEGGECNQLSCPEGSIPKDHDCAALEINGEDGNVGDTQRVCTNCQGCSYQVVAPDGSVSTGVTGDDGCTDIPLDMEGEYKVALVDDSGNPLIETILNALPKVSEPDKTPAAPGAGDGGGDIASLLFLILLLFLLLGGLIFFRRRLGGK